jgi:hypothetical protein
MRTPQWGCRRRVARNIGDTRVGVATFSAPVSAYKGSGAKNDITVVHNDPGSCHEAFTSVPSAPVGTIVRVVIDYGCP